MSCSVDIGRAIQEAQAHAGVGGPGTGACSSDLLLGALAACAQLTYQLVAAAMGIETNRIEAVVEGDLDLRGTLGIADDVPFGFERIRLQFEIEHPRPRRSSSRRFARRRSAPASSCKRFARPPEFAVELVAT